MVLKKDINCFKVYSSLHGNNYIYNFVQPLLLATPRTFIQVKPFRKANKNRLGLTYSKLGFGIKWQKIQTDLSPRAKMT